MPSKCYEFASIPCVARPDPLSNFTTFVTQEPTLQQISSSTDMTREDDSCVCGHHRRLHGPTRCHWLDCGCLTFDTEQVRR